MTIEPVEGWRFVAHAIVSCEGFIADADGKMPTCLHVPEDQARFRAALASADVTILGRAGHERHPAQGRPRLVLTSQVDGLDVAREGGGRVAYWNPNGTGLASALASFAGGAGGRTAVIAGGTQVMTTLLPVTDRFDLVVAPNCSIENGRPCLFGARSVDEIEALLATSGMARQRMEPLGQAELRVWARA